MPIYHFLSKYRLSKSCMSFVDPTVEFDYAQYHREKFYWYMYPIALLSTLASVLLYYLHLTRVPSEEGKIIVQMNVAIHTVGQFGLIYFGRSFKSHRLFPLAYWTPAINLIIASYFRPLVGCTGSLPAQFFSQFLIVFIGVPWRYQALQLSLAFGTFLFSLYVHAIHADWLLIADAVSSGLSILAGSYYVEVMMRKNFVGFAEIAFFQSKLEGAMGDQHDDSSKLSLASMPEIDGEGLQHALKRAGDMNLELKQALEAKKQFVASMSHELRSPLHCIMALTSAIERSMGKAGEEDYMIKAMLASGEHLSTIIEDILNFSSLEAGLERRDNGPFGLHNFAEKIMKLAGNMASGDVRYFHSVNVLQEIIFFGDEARLRQILQHLLSNSFKFTRHGHVSVDFVVGTSDFNSLQSDQMIDLTISVRDTGSGMAPDFIEKAFLPFVQSDNSIRRNIGGTGLGLSVVQKLVELLNGKVSCESGLGTGTTVTITIPVEYKVRCPSKITDQMLQDLTSTHVAVVGTLDQSVYDWLHCWLQLCGARLCKSPLLRLIPHRERKLLICTNATEEVAEKELNELKEEGAKIDDIPLLVLSWPNVSVNTTMDHWLALQNRKNRWTFSQPDKPLDLMGFISEIASHSVVTIAIPEAQQPSKGHVVPPPLSASSSSSSLHSVSPKLMGSPGKTPATTLASSVPQQQLATVSILLVDDSAVNRKVGKTLLAKCGYSSVVCACDGKEAVDLVEQKLEVNEPFQIILMDIHMPVMDGRAATTKILDMVKTPSTKPIIVACTADISEEKNPSPGIELVLTKPFTLAELQFALTECLRRRQTLCSLKSPMYPCVEDGELIGSKLDQTGTPDEFHRRLRVLERQSSF